MKKLVRVCATRDLEPREPRKWELEGIGSIALFLVEGKTYATSDRCTHNDASLSDDGDLDGFEIECGWHGCRFDVRTGEVHGAVCTVALKTYPVSVIDEEIFVELE